MRELEIGKGEPVRGARNHFTSKRFSGIEKRGARKGNADLAKHDDRRFGVKAGDSSPSFQVALLVLQVHLDLAFGPQKPSYAQASRSFPRVWSRGRCRQHDMKRQRWVEHAMKALPAGKARRVSRIRKARTRERALILESRESENQNSGPTSHSVRRS
jgi:hypothetical protein